MRARAQMGRPASRHWLPTLRKLTAPQSPPARSSLRTMRITAEKSAQIQSRLDHTP